MKRAIVLMTALVQTIGHKALIEFAGTVADKVHVILSSRTGEPISGASRIGYLARSVDRHANYHHHTDDKAPQNPDGTQDFWNYWRDVVRGFVPVISSDDIVVGSEPYILDMARVLGCQAMPFNMDRSILPVRGTYVRDNLFINWKDFVLPFRQDFCKTITFFGAESCGKTTMTKETAWSFGSPHVPEYAREYLELVGEDLTPDKMEAIHRGQYGIQVQAKKEASSPLIFQDTDILSTIGYYRLWKDRFDYESVKYDLDKSFRDTKSDLYFLMSDKIPFTPDPLRYGGTVRESDNSYWKALLEEYQCSYIEVPTGNVYDTSRFVFDAIEKAEEEWARPITSYRRQ